MNDFIGHIVLIIFCLALGLMTGALIQEVKVEEEFHKRMAQFVNCSTNHRECLLESLTPEEKYLMWYYENKFKEKP